MMGFKLPARLNGSKGGRTFKLITLGCKVNQYETQVIRENLVKSGFKESRPKSPADIYIINTCTITHRSDKESLYFISRCQRENPKAKIIVTGCLVELDKKIISRRKNAPMIVKNKNKYAIAALLNGSESVYRARISGFYKHTRAFLKIQDGCDNLCSYCKVPLVRGASRSRPLNEITDEARVLAGNGYKEIVLTGICLGSYGKDPGNDNDGGLVGLIEELEKIRGLMRIRLSSIEAGDVSDALIALIKRSKKLCRHLHIPIQSGDDEILKSMNRKYSRMGYLDLIRKIRKEIPGIAITTDCLVGFPGEKDENFKNTLDLIIRIKPLKVHIFPYSERKGTRAYGLAGKVGPNMVRDRLISLEIIANKCASVFQNQYLGKTMEVLFEGQVKGKPGFWQGYTDNYLKVMVKSGKSLRNKILPVKLKRLNRDCFHGGIT